MLYITAVQRLRQLLLRKLILVVIKNKTPKLLLFFRVRNCEEEESSPDTEEKFGLSDLSGVCRETGIFSFDREDTPSDGESLQNVIEQLTATSDDEDNDNISENRSLNIVKSPPIPGIVHSHLASTLICT